MTPTRLVAFLTTFMLTNAGSVLSAQTAPDTTFAPFRQGQWAVQFGASPSFVSLGFLRYTSAKRAWLMDFRFNLTEVDGETQTTVDTVTQTTDERFSNGSFNARIGRRFYPTLQDKVAGFLSVGVSGGYGRSTDYAFAGGRSRVSTWSVGVFGDFGADYFLASKLSVGGTFGLQAQYIRSDTDVDASSGNTQRRDRNQYDVRLSSGSLVLSLYF